ncbi:hypothetical protein [Streptomyces yaizuensis]|uniref:Uncharacterized protein n=1 Tax=Streptomyces yaizuensis TaxID=2989713 RepID=A0ABQ5P4L7_9ACTN|nr:hypothetical protein [Streptomyces sp. YSPA8]GLF97545.1 hypothetical protein SYYSPA8_24630 [Streptomyces sp. YSPA8]
MNRTPDDANKPPDLTRIHERLKALETFDRTFTVTPRKIIDDIKAIEEKLKNDPNRVSETVGKLSKSYVDKTETYVTKSYTDAQHSVTLTKISEARTLASLALTGATATGTGLSATGTALAATATALTVLTIGISLFKVDERGITILGATRKWDFTGWRKTFFDWLDKKMQNETQKREAHRQERRNRLVENYRTNRRYLVHYSNRYQHLEHYVARRHLLEHYGDQYRILKDKSWAAEVNKIARSGGNARAAQTNMRTQLGTSPAPSLRVPASGVGGPDLRTVANEVRVLRGTVNQLISALA